MLRYSLILLIVFSLVPACSSLPKQGSMAHPVTKDGYKLTVEFFPRLNGSPERRLPVLLVHGFLTNRNQFKIGNEKSIVHKLQAAGYDVYAMDFRGRSDAGDTGMVFGDKNYTYSIDDYAKYDLDTGLDYVLKKSGKPKVHYVAHSTGGLAAYIALGTFKETRIADMVTVASPGIMTPVDRYLGKTLKTKGALNMVPAVPLHSLSGMAANLHLKPVPGYLSLYFWHRENINRDTELQFMQHATSNISKPVMFQFVNAQLKRDFISKDGRINYSNNLKNIRIPAFLIAGRRDNTITPANVRYVYDNIASADKTMTIVSRAEGHATDYGHTDLLVGKSAGSEVLPEIVEWINRHD